MQPFSEGRVILIDKPLHWTSFGVVRAIRDLIVVPKVGHAGTLDPLATGLLIICTGNFTKVINEYMGMEKEYTGSFTIGSTTPTYDLESRPENFLDISGITESQIHLATEQFIGQIMQVPPIHSAIKQGGKPVYLAARKGEEVVLEPRPVTIKTFKITSIQLPKLFFRVVCSTGTYIRSLANDYGVALGVGAHMSSLRRTRIGQFLVENAQTVEAFEDEVKAMYAGLTT
jgi:tRNA pseudouridine55 synthase